MGLEDNVALVALAVSLVALIVALTQASQQLLGTAEGYRRCGKPVIDHWHRLRWRHWVWTEFRYETHFITPRFVLGPPNTNTTYQICLRDATKIASPKPSRRYWKWLRLRDRDDAAREAPAVLAATLLGGDDVEGATVWQEGQVIDEGSAKASARTDPEKGPDIESHAATQPKMITRIGLSRSENKVSWIPLLRRLHQAYEGNHDAKLVETCLSLDVSPEPAPVRDGTTETQANIQFQEWVWDVLPSDTSKPLAVTTLGTLVIFALRMGLRWHSLDLKKRELLASGHQFSLTFIEINGLGWLAKFTAPRHITNDTAPIIPSEAVDKMMCGIIPTCKGLVGEDLECIGDDRSQSTWLTLCRRLSLDVKVIRSGHAKPDWEAHNTEVLWWEPHNEAVTLLCQFLPIKDSSASLYYFWGISGNGRCVFTFYEGYFALWRRLRRLQDGNALSEAMQEVLRLFNFLEETYRMDFYAINNKRAVKAADGNTEADRREKQMRLLQDCRRIFRWTTDWFSYKERSFTQPSPCEEDEGQTLYVCLVAAHCYMSYQAIPKAKKKVQEARRKGRQNGGFDRAFKHQEYKLDATDAYGISLRPPEKYKFFNADMYHIGLEYTEMYDHDEHGIVNYMRKREVELSDEVLKDAWWVLMLRGVVWSLSTWRGAPGEPLPSSYYKNDTPIWIT